MILNSSEMVHLENLKSADSRVRLGRYIEISILSTVSNRIESKSRLLQFRYAFSICKEEKKGHKRDAIQRPSVYKANALTTQPRGLL